MQVSYTINSAGAIEAMRRYGKSILPKVKAVVTKWALIIEREVKMAAPVDTGMSRSQITHEIIEQTANVIGRVGGGANHTYWQEVGAKSHYVAAEKMRGWIRRHGLEKQLLEKKGLWVGPVGNKHFVPFDAAPGLREWARVRNFLERKAVKVSGKAQPHFGPVFAKYKDDIVSDMQRALGVF